MKKKGKKDATTQIQNNEQNGSKNICINNYLNCNRLYVPIKGHRGAEWIQNKTLIYAAYKRHFRSHFRHTKTETEGIEKVFHANRNQNKAGVAILIWGKTKFLKIETVTKTKKDTL